MLRIDFEDRLLKTARPSSRADVLGERETRTPNRNLTPTDDPTAPDLTYLKTSFAEALQSFYATLDRIQADNPVPVERFLELGNKAGIDRLSEDERTELQNLKAAAVRQGRAVGGVLGFFLKYKPYPMLAEIRSREKLFQPPFGPIMVVDGDCVRDVLSRHDDFTVDPYGREMIKSMTPAENGGFDAFILGTDDPEKFVMDKRLMTTVVNKNDATQLTDLIHRDCIRRVRSAVDDARRTGAGRIDIVKDLARLVPVTLTHHFFGIPVADQKGKFDLTDDMLRYYGSKVAGPDGKTPLPLSVQRLDGQVVDLPDSALGRTDGVIPDAGQVYEWIKASFQNFFNNVQKDIEVQATGVRAYRELLVHLLREVDIQRAALNEGKSVPDTMLTRLLKLQMGLADPALTPQPGVDQDRLGDLRIAENVMGTVVGAVAGQEEATCRVIDALIRLKEGDFAHTGRENLTKDQRYGSYDEARQLALNVLNGQDVANSRAVLHQYVLEALRLQPQAETLLRECRADGATISGSRPIRAGTLIFAAHGSAMKDVDNPDAFILGRDEEHYLHYGRDRHKCLGQYLSPVILVESLIAVLALNNIRRPKPEPDDSLFPFERRLGRLQLDDNNLYATSFILDYDLEGTTERYFC